MNVDHIGYAVKNIDASRQAFEELGYVFDPVTIPPAPACAFGGRRVAFLYHLQIGLLELVEA